MSTIEVPAVSEPLTPEEEARYRRWASALPDDSLVARLFATLDAARASQPAPADPPDHPDDAPGPEANSQSLRVAAQRVLDDWNRIGAQADGYRALRAALASQPAPADPEPPLPPSCDDGACPWASVPHVHEGDAVYPAPPDDPKWVAALASQEDA